MKRKVTIFLIFMFVFCAAAFSQSITTQGVLRDGTGHSVADGTYTITFRIYDNETGGAPVWETTESVDVTNGIYNVILGSTDDPLDMLNSDGSYWLGVEIGSDGEMTPLLKLSLSPYEFAKMSGDENVFPSAGNVGVGTTDPQAKLQITGTNNNQLRLQYSSSYWDIYRSSSDGTLNFDDSENGIGLSIKPNGEILTSNLYRFGWATGPYIGTVNTSTDDADMQGFAFYPHGSATYNAQPEEKMRLTHNGYLGIGTETPDYTLSVNGWAEVMGTDFMLGTNDQHSPGTKPKQRALVHGSSDKLIMNYGGDFEGGVEVQSDLDIEGKLTINDYIPIRIRRYTKSATRYWDHNTNYTTANWSAVIAGFSAGYCDVWENDAHDSWKVIMVKNSDGYWHVSARGHTHSNSPDWTIDVMFIRRDLVDDNR